MLHIQANVQPLHGCAFPVCGMGRERGYVGRGREIGFGFHLSKGVALAPPDRREVPDKLAFFFFFPLT